MSKDTTKKGDSQEKNLFSFSDVLPDKKIQVDFNAPDLSSNGGLVLVGLMKESIARKVARLIPDHRNQLFVQHSYEEMVCQRVGQIMCGYEDANDCDRLRHDSALKMSVGRKASDPDLCSQPTMTRLENHLDKKTLWAIAELFSRIICHPSTRLHVKSYSTLTTRMPTHTERNSCRCSTIIMMSTAICRWLFSTG